MPPGSAAIRSWPSANELALVAVPVWKGKPLYQSYLIGRSDLKAESLADLAGTVHAFSDPDSNSGYLVTCAALAEMGTSPGRFFRQFFYTYGHRNVVRAVRPGSPRAAASMATSMTCCARPSRTSWRAPGSSADPSCWDFRRSPVPPQTPEPLPLSRLAGGAGRHVARRAWQARARHAAARRLQRRAAALFDGIAAKMKLVRGAAE